MNFDKCSKMGGARKQSRGCTFFIFFFLGGDSLTDLINCIFVKEYPTAETHRVISSSYAPRQMDKQPNFGTEERKHNKILLAGDRVHVRSGQSIT